MGDLKKHILKRFLLESELTQAEREDLEKSPTAIRWSEAKNIKKLKKDQVPMIYYEDKRIVLGFHYRIQGRDYIIPEPDPVLMYFNTAYLNFKKIKQCKKDLITEVTSDTPSDAVIEPLYDFFGQASGCIIMLFTALEAFTNRAIPAEFVYVKDQQGKRTEHYTKNQIERHVSFDEKLMQVLNQIFKPKKNFHEAHPLVFETIQNLKETRDNLIHLKSAQNNEFAYSAIYKKLFDYKYEKALTAVKDFCNYYHPKPDYISECNCGNPD